MFEALTTALQALSALAGPVAFILVASILLADAVTEWRKSKAAALDSVERKAPLRRILLIITTLLSYFR